MFPPRVCNATATLLGKQGSFPGEKGDHPQFFHWEKAVSGSFYVSSCSWVGPSEDGAEGASLLKKIGTGFVRWPGHSDPRPVVLFSWPVGFLDDTGRANLNDKPKRAHTWYYAESVFPCCQSGKLSAFPVSSFTESVSL